MCGVKFSIENLPGLITVGAVKRLREHWRHSKSSWGIWEKQLHTKETHPERRSSTVGLLQKLHVHSSRRASFSQSSTDDPEQCQQCQQKFTRDISNWISDYDSAHLCTFCTQFFQKSDMHLQDTTLADVNPVHPPPKPPKVGLLPREANKNVKKSNSTLGKSNHTAQTEQDCHSRPLRPSSSKSTCKSRPKTPSRILCLNPQNRACSRTSHRSKDSDFDVGRFSPRLLPSNQAYFQTKNNDAIHVSEQINSTPTNLLSPQGFNTQHVHDLSDSTPKQERQNKSMLLLSNEIENATWTMQISNRFHCDNSLLFLLLGGRNTCQQPFILY